MTTLGRAPIALLLGALLLAGCGEESPTDAVGRETSSPSPSEPSMSTGDPEQEPTVVALISASNAGGRVSLEPVPIGDPESLAAFTRGLDGRFARDVAQQARNATVPDGQTLLAAVVGISCEAVMSVQVKVRDGGPVIVVPPQKSDKQCLVPVTTVVIVTAIV